MAVLQGAICHFHLNLSARTKVTWPIPKWKESEYLANSIKDHHRGQWRLGLDQMYQHCLCLYKHHAWTEVNSNWKIQGDSQTYLFTQITFSILQLLICLLTTNLHSGICECFNLSVDYSVNICIPIRLGVGNTAVNKAVIFPSLDECDKLQETLWAKKALMRKRDSLEAQPRCSRVRGGQRWWPWHLVGGLGLTLLLPRPLRF